jgi:hypothetical protein
MLCRHKKNPRWLRWAFPVSGLISLAWFLVRVIPKPSRAAYPCQRMAAPLASGFVLWAIGVFASMTAFRTSARLIRARRVRLALACAAIAIPLGIGAFLMLPSPPARADNPEPNAPIGVARGINPGRVVWTHDANATDWAGPGEGNWWEPAHTNQAAVDRMLSKSLQSLTGARSDAEAWQAVFRFYNKAHSGADVAYKAGEKIAIKVNLVGCIVGRGSSVDPDSYAMTKDLDYMNASPQMMTALLR